MTYKTHIIGGVALAIAINEYLIPIEGIELVYYYGSAIVGSLLPDLDHPKSWISSKTVILHYPFRKLGHRKATHSLFAAILLWAVLTLPFGINFVALGSLLGYLSHLILDILNPTGVPLLYPFTKEKYKIGKIHTGDTGEYIVTVLLIIISVVMIRI